MTIKKFIDRPLMSMVINIMIVAVGIIAATQLPIEKYPDIAPPSVYLWASYPGASAETVQKSVVAPLERAINGVDNMMYMKSSAERRNTSLTQRNCGFCSSITQQLGEILISQSVNA